MTTKVKLWFALAFLVVFLAGGAVGLFAGAYQVRRHFGHGPRGFSSERMREHLRRELQLTPEQTAQVNPVIDRTAAQLESIRRETGERVLETMRASHSEIAPLLTEEQRARLDQMRQRHLRGMGRWHRMPPRDR